MVGKRVTNRISVNHFFHFNCPKDIKLALCQMIGQSATGQVQLLSYLEVHWISLLSLSILFEDRVEEIMIDTDILSTHCHAYFHYHIGRATRSTTSAKRSFFTSSESLWSCWRWNKRCLVKFRIGTLGTGSYKIRTLLGTWHYLTLHLRGFVSNLPPSGGQQDLPWYLEAKRRDLIWASGGTFSTIVIVINGMIMAMLLEMAE